MTVEISLQQAESAVLDILKGGLVPNILSSPGVGKSDLVRKIAKENNLKVIDLRLAQLDPTDLNGFPSLNEERTRSHYAPPIIIPLAHDKVPEDYDGWILFLDEMNSAPLSVQAAAYKIVLDRMVGEYKIHPNVAIICAGNLSTDKAIVSRLSTAMQSRMVHLQVHVDDAAWINWAIDNKIDYRVIGFIRFRPDLLQKFDPNHNDHTFPCPRTWEFLSRIIKPWEEVSASKLATLAGTIGEGPAIEFKGFADIFKKLPTKDQLLKEAKTIPVPEEPSTLFAVTSLISNIVSENNIETLMDFINRLPVEFQVITLQGVLKGDDKLLAKPALKMWVTKNADELM